MSVPSTTNRVAYTGDGATKVYDYTYEIKLETDLLVTVTDLSDVETTLVLATDYTVSDVGIAGGGAITLVDAGQAWLDGGGDLLTGFTLTIRRVLVLTQDTDIRNQGDFLPEVHEDEFDRSRMIDQQQQDELDRSLKMAESVDPATFDTTIPASIVGQSRVTFTTNAAGDGIEEGPTTAEIEAAEANALLAKDWAEKTDGIVDATDYSSKAFAIGGTGVTDTAGRGAAKEWATKAEDSTVDTSGYSALHHAAKASASASAAAASASSVLAAIPYRDVVYVTVGDSPLTITAADAGKFYAIDASGGAITINLPSIALVTSTPKAFGFKKTDSSVNKITLVQNGSDEIDEAAANLLIESQNAAYMMLADTDATPDSWTSLAYGGGNGIGGGTPIKWSEQALAPIKTIQNGIESYDFEDTITQYLYAFLKVPESYIQGGQIKMRSLFFTLTTTGNVLLTGLTTLIRPGTDAMSSTTNQHTSVNTAVTVNGVADVPTEAVIDLTDTAGAINSVSVSAGDLLLIRITRDTATDTLADQARVLSESSEVTYV